VFSVRSAVGDMKLGENGPGGNAELVHKLHIALHAPHAALPMESSKFRPSTDLPMLDQNATII
jgi:hypothetical protein